MRGRRELKRMWENDPNMRELIDSLWREYYGLYNERYMRDPEKWKKNELSTDADYAQAIGQDHRIIGNKAIGVGIGHIVRSLVEIALGSYCTEDLTQNPREWIQTDRLVTIGNGKDEDNRHDVLLIYKNGLFELFQAMVLGAYPDLPEGQKPKEGSLQYLTKTLRLYFDDAWHELALKSDIPAIPAFPEIPDDHVTTAIQLAHGFTIGQAVKLDQTAGQWVLTKADRRENAGTMGVVCSVIDSDTFQYRHGGILPDPGNLFVDGEDYFLSPTVPGALIVLQDPEVWEYGNIREYIGTGSNGGLLIEIDLGEEITEELAAGKSAYELAVDHGFPGTETEWLDSLKGGDGNPGKSAYEIALQDGFAGTEEEWLLSLSTPKWNEYTALVSQTGANVPTIIILQNTIGNIVVSRVSAGVYRFVLAGAFVGNKTAPVDDCMMDQWGNFYTLNRVDVNTMELTTYAAADITVPADGVLNNRYINFRVYP